MKNIKHYVIIGVEIILLGVIGVSASTNVPSYGVSYTNSSSKSSISTVEGALNELYNSFKVGNATAAQILTGQTALVQGKTVTGSMANNGELNWAPESATSYTLPTGYYSGGTISTINAYNAGKTAGTNEAGPNSITMQLTLVPLMGSTNDGGTIGTTSSQNSNVYIVNKGFTTMTCNFFDNYFPIYVSLDGNVVASGVTGNKTFNISGISKILFYTANSGDSTYTNRTRVTVTLSK